MKRTKRRFSDSSAAMNFLTKFPDDRMQVSSVMHLYNAIGTGIEANARVVALAANGTHVPICIHKEDGVLIITRD